MRRGVIAWIALILVLPAVWLLLTAMPGGGRGLNAYREALGMSLAFLAITLSHRSFWPKPGQVDHASLVFMAVSTLPQWLVANGARWRIKWRMVAHIAWGTLLFLSLTSVVVALLGDSLDAVFLGAVGMMLNCLGSVIVMVARLPAARRQG